MTWSGRCEYEYEYAISLPYGRVFSLISPLIVPPKAMSQRVNSYGLKQGP